MKPPAKDAHRKLREKLSRLCDSPIAGEAAAARHKLERLLEKYDFEAKPEPREGDLFDGVVIPKKGRKATLLFSFEPSESDVAGLVQWAIEKAYAVEATIRSGADWRSSVWVEASAESVPELQRVSATIRSHFVTLWETLRKSANVDQADRRPFLLGLYDGMMDDPRQPGQMLPNRTGMSGKRKKKQKAAPSVRSSQPGLTTHPYALALDLGRQIRFRASVHKTTAALKQAIAGAIPVKADGHSSSS